MLGLTQIQHVRPVRRGAAIGLVAQVYRQMEADFGVLAPPIALHAGSPTMLAAAWVLLRETLIVPGAMSRAEKEAVAAAVSRQNACPYCVTVHDSMVTRLGAGRSGPAGTGDDPELIAMILVMHYLNRMVNVFLRDVPLPPGAPSWALQPVLRVLGADLSRAGRKPHPAGASLELLPAAELPADLSWAAGSDHLATVLARVCAAVKRGGRRSTGDPVRALVLDELSRWNGEPAGLSRAWVEERLAGLPDGDRPVARLALLVAFASYQVDAGVMLDCRAAGADDAALIDISAWSALAAACRMSHLASRGVPER